MRLATADEGHVEAARALKDLPPDDAMALIAEVKNKDLFDAEAAKPLPQLASRFTAEELGLLKAHLLDGGGVEDDAELLAVVMQAVMDDDWDTVFREIPHVLKSWFKQRGAVTATPNGVMYRFSPTGSAPVCAGLGNTVPPTPIAK